MFSGIELPRINDNYNGRKYRYAYAWNLDTKVNQVYTQLENWLSVSLAWINKTIAYHFIYLQVVKIDTELKRATFWSGDDDTYLSEPVFVERPEATTEDDGKL